MSGFHRRPTAATALFVLFLLAGGTTCLLAAARRVVDDDGSRRMQQTWTTRQSHGVVVRTAAPATRLFDYLPRPRVIPRSGPSEGHNSIGQTKEEEEAGDADGRP